MLIACFTAAPTALLPTPAKAQATSPSETDTLARAVADASQRFAIPEAWIRAVMGVESAGDPRAVSVKGAMGLMQIMPATWAAFRVRYALGSDPYDVRANIMAGAACLRAMLDRYGDPVAMLAAYNAGPGRYDDYLRGRALPAETRAYVARLAPVIGAATASPARSAIVPDPLAWTRSALFAARGAMPAERSSATTPLADQVQSEGTSEDRSGVTTVVATPTSPSLFVSLSVRSSQ